MMEATALWLRAMGVAAYIMIVGFFAFWSVLGVAYYNAKRGRYWLIISVTSALLMVLFLCFTAVASEPHWLLRDVTMIITRTTAMAAAISGWYLTAWMLTREWSNRGS